MIENKEIAVVIGNLMTVVGEGTFQNIPFKTVGAVLQDGQKMLEALAEETADATSANAAVADITEEQRQDMIRAMHEEQSEPEAGP